MNSPVTIRLDYENILLAAEDSYRRISEAKEIPLADVHRSEVCQAASGIMVRHELLAGDSSIKGIDRLIPLFQGKGGFAEQHAYLVQYSDDGETVIDPTWQQFLPKDVVRDELPKVAMGSREEVVDLFKSAGMPEAALDFWRPLEQAESVIKERTNGLITFKNF